MNRLQLIIGISGASGAFYAVSFLRSIANLVPGKSSIIISEQAIGIFNREYHMKVRSASEYVDFIMKEAKSKNIIHSFSICDYHDVGAKPASGSAQYDGMIVIPCSMKTIASIAHGYSTNLIERAADVTLKECRKLVVVPRETPYSLIHLKNMTAIAEAGGIVLPASPAFYQEPKTFDDLANFIVGRILSLFAIEHQLFPAWEPDKI